MPHRPLVFVSALTLGDYLLWNWSLNSNHAVLELVSGLSLPPLAVVWLWLVALTLARLLAHGTGRSLDRAGSRRRRRRSEGGGSAGGDAASAAPGAAGQGAAGGQETPAMAASARSSRGKLAA